MIGIDLDVQQLVCDLIVNVTAHEIDAAAWYTIVRCATTWATGVRGRTGQLDRSSVICEVIVDEALEQIVMLAAHHTMLMTLLKDCKTPLELICRNDRFPLTAYRLGRNIARLTDQPARICPIVKDGRQCVRIDLALPGLCHFHEWTTAFVAVAACMQFFGNAFERKFVLQQQIERQADDRRTFRVLLNPCFMSPRKFLCLTSHSPFDIEIAIRRAIWKASACPLRLQTTLHADTQERGLAPCKRERKRNNHTIIRVLRIKIRLIGKANGYTKFVQFIDGTQCFSIIASKSIGAFNDDMRKLSSTRVCKHSLIAFTFWCLARQHIDVCVVYGHW